MKSYLMGWVLFFATWKVWARLLTTNCPYKQKVLSQIVLNVGLNYGQIKR